MSSNPYSTYDCLSVTLKLEKLLGDVAIEELHMFSYLSCLLSLYDGKGISFWNYGFIKNRLGAPYSSSLNDAIDALEKSVSIVIKEGYIQITEKGRSQLTLLSSLDLNNVRERYLSSAVKCIEYSPFSTVKEALFNEPVLKDSFGSLDRKNLIDEEDFSLKQLYGQFNNLHKALKGQYSEHLVVPAMTWMSFLLKHQIG